jgi:D-alanyl-D-alanine carboxypeptidase
MTNLTRRLFGATAFAALLTVSAPAFAADTTALAAAIDKTAAAAISAGESPGLQVAVFKDGKPVLVKAYGKANLELQVPVGNDSVFRIGSVTKQFTAAAILKLAEEGKLSLDDKLSKYYPDFPRAGDITLQRMLNHTSGIHNYTEEPTMLTDAYIHRTTDEMVVFLGKLPKTQDFEPGADWHYSNSAFSILGGVVEKVSGQSLGDFLKTRFFTPLGMTHTAYDDETEILPGRASGYAAEGKGKFTNAGFLSMTFPGGGGSLRSSASDLAKWNAALFGGKVLKPESFTAMTTPGRLTSGATSGAAMRAMMAGMPNLPGDLEYGYGLQTSTFAGHAKVSHGGGIHGFNASVSEFPKDHVTVIVLSNTIGKDVGAAPVADKIERLAIGAQ